MARNEERPSEALEFAHLCFLVLPDCRHSRWWVLSHDGVPVLPVPTGTACTIEVARRRMLLDSDAWAHPWYAPKLCWWDDTFTDERTACRQSYPGVTQATEP
jgi:hypothetical protein